MAQPRALPPAPPPMRAIPAVVAALAALAAAVTLVGACTAMPRLNDAEIGCTFDASSSPLCPGYVVPAPLPKPEGGAGEGGAGEGGAAAGLGAPCTGPSDCASFPASYCLVAPTGSFPSFCTYTSCSAALCGAAYRCCDCTASPVPSLKVYPAGICVLPTTAAGVAALGCLCTP